MVAKCWLLLKMSPSSYEHCGACMLNFSSAATGLALEVKVVFCECTCMNGCALWCFLGTHFKSVCLKDMSVLVLWKGLSGWYCAQHNILLNNRLNREWLVKRSLEYFCKCLFHPFTRREGLWSLERRRSTNWVTASLNALIELQITLKRHSCPWKTPEGWW